MSARDGGEGAKRSLSPCRDSNPEKKRRVELGEESNLISSDGKSSIEILPMTQPDPAISWMPDFKAGAKLLVQWEIGEAEENAAEVATVWWGCEYKGASEERDDQKRVIHLLGYEAREQFEACTSKVVFLSNELLWDVEYGSELNWKLRPDGFTAQDETTNVRTMVEVVKDQEESDRRVGLSPGILHQKGMEAVEGLPQETQMRIASMYRDFSDRFRDHLASLKREREDGVVTAEDVTQIIDKIRENGINPRPVGV